MNACIFNGIISLLSTAHTAIVQTRVRVLYCMWNVCLHIFNWTVLLFTLDLKSTTVAIVQNRVWVLYCMLNVCLHIFNWTVLLFTLDCKSTTVAILFCKLAYEYSTVCEMYVCIYSTELFYSCMWNVCLHIFNWTVLLFSLDFKSTTVAILQTRVRSTPLFVKCLLVYFNWIESLFICFALETALKLYNLGETWSVIMHKFLCDFIIPSHQLGAVDP